ncbi:MAG: 50S ribosomal protein L23, partial [Desulfofustis sp.]
LKNQVVFKVHPEANKIEIKEAVEKMFKVKVGNVRTASMRGKQKRVGRYIGYTKDWKKAYVTLSEGAISFVDEL